jgi:hypothetical protein
MQIIIRKADGLVPYIFSDGGSVELGAALKTPEFVVGDVNSDTHKLITGPAPEFFVGGYVMGYKKDWFVANQESYDAAFAVWSEKELQRIAAEVVAATQQRLDAFAQTRNYDGILSACTYADDPVQKFAAEGQYCVAARGATWAKLYEILGEVESGSRPVPSSYADIENELPALAWPE